PLAGLEGTRIPVDDPQIEAVCADGAGRVLLLQESPPRAELVDPAARRVVASIALEVPGEHPLAAAWLDPTGSRGEGAVFLASGHLLVAKEKDPPALIEFGPAGEAAGGYRPDAAVPDGAAWPVAASELTFVPLATWTPDAGLRAACRDFSDLEVGPDGRLYLLSDQSASIARLGDLHPPGGTARADATWALGRLRGKPEGLAFTARGLAIVALDTRRARDNLALFEPAIAAREVDAAARPV
ncbi:MAG: SdiA-regulated domain-containing protein, partial [Chloroflexi bacterium]|nr:SdiA-regulated domain-containing protein [Chloroflexota bacterium]